MLDVHPPHAATHTWKDFFIHIATIVIGLLIAVGLEQTVEAIHHRSEVSETRKALAAEFEENLLVFRFNLAGTRLVRQEMGDNLAILLYLKQHPGTKEAQLPGTLDWYERNNAPIDAAWKVAQQSSVTAFMPRNEVAQLNATYTELTGADASATELWHAMNVAARFAQADPDPSHLSASQLDREIELVEACLDANYRWVVSLHDLTVIDTRFTPNISMAYLDDWQGRPRSGAELQSLTAAQKLTDNREKGLRDALAAALADVKAHQTLSNE